MYVSDTSILNSCLLIKKILQVYIINTHYTVCIHSFVGDLVSASIIKMVQQIIQLQQLSEELESKYNTVVISLQNKNIFKLVHIHTNVTYHLFS